MEQQFIYSVRDDFVINKYRKMIGILKNGQKVEVKKIIPDWNRVETNDNQIFALWEFEVIYSS